MPLDSVFTERRVATCQTGGRLLADRSLSRLLKESWPRSLEELRTAQRQGDRKRLHDLRPDLSEIASGFLRDLTAGRYTELELNESYEATIVEPGEPKPVISGGEEDIASKSVKEKIREIIVAEGGGKPLSDQELMRLLRNQGIRIARRTVTIRRGRLLRVDAPEGTWVRDDADADLMLRIANRTNGKTFKGDPESIETIYNAISAEQ